MYKNLYGGKVSGNMGSGIQRSQVVVKKASEVMGANWCGMPPYTAEVVALIDYKIESGQRREVRRSFCWRYTNLQMDEYIYGKPVKTADEAHKNYNQWANESNGWA